MKKIFPYLLTVTTMFTSAAWAQGGTTTWMCTVNGLERRVELNEAMTEAPVCDVWYDKSAEGGAKMRLWSADNDGDYCRPKAEQLVESLTNWGWTCEAMAAEDQTP